MNRLLIIIAIISFYTGKAQTSVDTFSKHIESNGRSNMYIIHVNTVGLFKHAWEKNKNKKEGGSYVEARPGGGGHEFIIHAGYNAFGPGHESSNDP